MAVTFERERNRRASFFVARIAVAASISGVVAACSIGTMTTALIAPKLADEGPAAVVKVTTPGAMASVQGQAPATLKLDEATLRARPYRPIETVIAETPVVPEADEATLRARPYRTVGKPYQIAGSWYEPKEDPNYDRTGMASWYGAAFHGRMTANGEIFDSALISAAHPTLPLPSYVRVTNMENNRSIMVRVNDRGPFRHKRLIDVSEHTARLLGFHRRGLTQVRVQYVSKAPLDREDESVLLASYTAPDAKPADAEIMLASVEPSRVPAPRPATVVAFAAEERTTPAAATGPELAIASLAGEYSATDRILIAFDVASSLPE